MIRMPKVRSLKQVLSATVPKHIKDRCIELGQTDEYSSASDVVTVGLSYYFGMLDYRERQKLEQNEEYRQNKDAAVIILKLISKNPGIAKMIKEIQDEETKKNNHTFGFQIK